MNRLLAMLLPLLAEGVPAAQAPKPRILIAPVEVLERRALPEQARPETQADIAAHVERRMATRLFEGGAELVRAADPASLRARLAAKGAGKAEYAAVAAEAKVDAVLLIQVLKWEQKNRTPSEILAAPNKPGSQTYVEMRVWLYNAREGLFAAEGGKPWSSRIDSPFFGTQRRDELVGAPADKMLAIKQTNLRRIRAIADAAYETVRPSLAAVLKLDLR